MAQGTHAASPLGAFALVIRILRILLHADLLNFGLLVIHACRLLS